MGEFHMINSQQYAYVLKLLDSLVCIILSPGTSYLPNLGQWYVQI